MKQQRRVKSMLAVLLMGGLAAFPAVAADPGTAAGELGASVIEALSDWVVKSGDNVCGVTDARQISNPAKVRYQDLLNATSSMKDMKRKGIKPDSPEGQILHNKAVDSVRKAADTVKNSKGHCSVWKKIRNRKGVAVTDITAEVKKHL